MFFQQFKVDGLGCLSYMIGCPRDGRVIVVDPKRDIADYLLAAKEQKMVISHIIETHVHADHISGAMELRKATGAAIHIGAGSPVSYDHIPLHDGDELILGAVKMEFIATPGHTPHAVSVAVADLVRGKMPQLLLTGDLLFVGSIGRPDLAGDELLDEQIANLYNSLYSKLSRFGDYVEVYPAHGEGSLCGAGLSAKPSSTLGYERHTNPYFNHSREDFKQLIKREIPHRPKNFSTIIATNKQGASVEEALPVVRAKSPAAIKQFLSNPQEHVLVDLREAAAFGGAHIPGSINIGMTSNSASWIGNVVDPAMHIILLGDRQEQITMATTMFRRVGYDRIVGSCIGLSDWILTGNATGFLPQVSIHSLQDILRKYPNHTIIDIRTEAEWQAGHLAEAIHLPLPRLLAKDISNSRADHISLICGSGYRSNIGASMLKNQGWQNTYSVIGGMNAWRAAGFSMVS
ncbi:MAG: MBL fold metallo-hydrolase [Deltaproteobacteria bacterium]|nr:MBL fold metallo-hydrolase [Candidatus Anaeroferrophillus wilburensis]MBN2888945.1 MBL fold metallo-hydrolase [Deltaproteobacteria bacterium]